VKCRNRLEHHKILHLFAETELKEFEV